jgi:cell division septation protein DedD
MANRYYPEFYLRKRQRDAVYKRVTTVAGTLLIIAVGVFIGFLLYKNLVEPRRNEPGASPAAAVERTNLSTEQRLQDLAAEQARNSPEGGPSQTAGAAPKLDDVPYAQSFPEVSVGVAASGAAGAAPAGAGPSADTAGGTSPAGGAGSGEAGTGVGQASPSGGADTTPPATQPGGQAPGSTSGGSNSQAGRPQGSQAGNASEQPKEKPKEKPKDKPKEKPKEESKPAEPKPSGESQKPEEQPKPGQPAAYVYRVYAGSYASREAAEGRKSELGALGLSGSVIQSGGEYNLLVGQVDTLDSASALVNKLKGSGFSAAFASRKRK